MAETTDRTDARLMVTVDTNILDDAGMAVLNEAARSRPIDIAVVTVSEREQGKPFKVVLDRTMSEAGVWNESQWEALGGRIRQLAETFVLDESRLDEAVLGDSDGVDLLEDILGVISRNSFPSAGQREALTPGQLRQLRDAMILQAHARNRRNVFITNDARGFVSHGRREQLEALCKTRIRTLSEFRSFVENG